MAKITNPSKLLASSKSSSITKIGKSNILAKTSPLSKGLLATRQSKDVSDANNKLVNIDKFLKSDLIVSQKKAEVKRKKKEKQDFDEAEKKLETPQSKKFKLPGFNLPSLGFMDRVKRFLFFTALGWLLPKIIEFLPKLEGFAKIVGGIYKFAEGLFGNLFNGFMSLVKFGGDLKDKTLGFIASAKAGVGGNYQKEFEKLEKQFNTFANASIIAGLVGLDMGLAGLDEFNKQKKKGQKPAAGKPAAKAGAKVTQGRGGKKPSGKPKVTTGKGGKVPGWWNNLFKGPFAKLKGPLSKFAGAAVPGLGAAVGAADAAARFKSGDNIGGALASVSAGLDTITAVLALTGVGLPAAAIFGGVSIGIDILLLIRDIAKVFFPFIPMFSRGGRVVKRYQGGGTTRGGRPVGGPKRRTITPTRRKPPRVTIPKTQPGKDVGGEKKVKEFYAKPEDPNKRYTRPAGGWLANLGKERQDLSAFDTLKKMSGTLKSDETLAKGILGVMSSGIDMALGQKPDKKIFKAFFDSIGYIADTLANQRTSKSMSSLRSQIGAFAEGGTIPSRGLRGTYSDANTGDMLAKLIGPTIDQRVNEAIQSIEKQLQMKGAAGPGGRPPGARPGADPGAGPDGLPLYGGPGIEGLSDFIAKAETGGRWNAYNGDWREGKKGDTSILSLKLTELRSYMNNNYPNSSGAVGAYQFMPETAIFYARQLGLDPSKTVFSPEIQRKLNIKHLRDLGYDDYAAGKITRDQYGRKIAQQYRAVPDPTTGFTYSDSASSRNKATVSLQDYNSALDNAKQKAQLISTSPGKIPKADYIKGVLDESGEPGFDVTWKGDNNIAVLPGRVKEVGPLYGSGYGNVVVVESVDPVTGKKVDVMYAHFPNGGISVREGQQVSSGQVLGRMGKQGEPGIGNISGQHASIDFYEPNTRRGQITGRYSRWDELSREIISSSQSGNNPSNWPKPQAQKSPGQQSPQTPISPTSTRPSTAEQLRQRGIPVQGRLQAGGLVSPLKPNRAIPNSFASYETPGGGMMIAIQPMIIEKPVPVSGGGNKMIAFPVPVAVNSNMDLSLSRG